MNAPLSSQTNAPEKRASLVVDASAIIAVLIDPGDTGTRAAQSIHGHGLHAPAHLPVEVTNVLRRQWAAGHLTEAEAKLALQGLWDMNVTLWPFELTVERSWQLGGAMTTYDAAYVALAEHLNVTLLTLDARLARAPGIRASIDVIG